MTHVYEGEPDARQADTRIAVTRFRPRYRALSEAEKDLHDQIKAKAAELEALFDQTRGLIFGPTGPASGDHRQQYLNDGMTALELSVMWTVKALTA